VGSAVGRVEQRLFELTQIVRSLQGKLHEGAIGAAQKSDVFEVFIDLQSASNFYRWKQDGDVLRNGGVFVACQRPLPNIGTTVAVHIALPGGVTFASFVIVEWSRPAGGQSASWHPGFGGRFSNLPPDMQQIVYQFVLAREPMVFEQG
jgi:hypothetical protein